MNKKSIPDPDLENILKQALKDDLPHEAEARMNRQFLSLRRSLDRPEGFTEADEWPWRGVFRKEILAVASAAMIILGIVMQLSASQSALAHTIEKVKVITTVTLSLSRAVSMKCTVLKRTTGGENTSYRMLWRANGDARVDMVSSGGSQTIWISDGTISFAGSDGGSIRSMPLETIAPRPVWQPAMEFRTPALLAKQMEARYGLMQAGERSGAGSGEFSIVGHEGRQAVEITVDSKTYLPKTLKKYALDSGRTNGNRICLVEARFHWNQPIPGELFVPGLFAGRK